VATALVNGPATRNALSRGVQDQLLASLEAAEHDDAVRTVVITGVGDRVAAGADLRHLRDYTVHDGLAGRLQSVFGRIESLTKPTVAAVNGWALGGGCELAMAREIRVASASARFGLPETGLGIVSGAGGTQRLARLVGLGRAIDLILTGRVLDARQALDIGLVSYLAEPAELLAPARQVAAAIAARGALATRLAKVAVRAALDTDLRTGLALERLAQSILHTTQTSRKASRPSWTSARPTSTGADMNTDTGPPPSSGSETATGPHGRQSIQDVLVVGSGAMRPQIAMACALAGYRVTVQDISPQSLTRAEISLREIVDRRLQKGRVSSETRDAAFARLVFTTPRSLTSTRPAGRPSGTRWARSSCRT
jgi:enoyl-CoA hydratase/carnithine racemase